MRHTEIGRVRFVWGSMRSRNGGFSLVELLVVIGIIAILLAILTPTISRVREQARRTQCAANLKDFGVACAAFANAHQGYFPMCYRIPLDPNWQTATSYINAPFRFPMFIGVIRSSDPTKAPLGVDFNLLANAQNNFAETPPNVYYSNGTTWSTFTDYGVTLKNLSCPSYPKPATMVFVAIGGIPMPYGDVVRMNYMYVGGLTSAGTASATAPASSILLSGQHWGTAVPAVTNHDGVNLGVMRDTSTTQVGHAIYGSGVLGADNVFYTGGAAYSLNGQVQTNYIINHAKWNDPTRPDFQNVLYADGHVEGHGPESFANPLGIESSPAPLNNYSFVAGPLSSISPLGGFFYWGEGESQAKLDPPGTYPNKSWYPPPPGGGSVPPPPPPPIPDPPKQPSGPIPTPPPPLN